MSNLSVERWDKRPFQNSGLLSGAEYRKPVPHTTNAHSVGRFDEDAKIVGIVP
ncbi:MAG: hypothetical protein M5U34_12690 [Chloroflexi bacterium]|nr:hypothetical protein [Chloroflexota bacterium]